VRTPQPLPAELAGPLAQAASRLGPLGSPVLWFDEIGSTNDVAVRLAERGAPEGSVIAANAQVAGRGRLGRVWVSPPGAGLYVSVVLRPERPTSLLTLAAGVAIATGLQHATGLSVELKWPNDVYVGRRKLAGILAEGGTSPARGAFVVVGIGVNIQPAAFPPELAEKVTSLEGELGRPVDRGLVFAECLAGLYGCYSGLRADDGRAVLGAWRARAQTFLGRAVEWDDAGVASRGTAVDVAADGGLVVETGKGLRHVTSGEVRWL
jgi:BirA family biotin operon repressor/biotin-[acetyl-CoA-carboxylase] ligase